MSNKLLEVKNLSISFYTHVGEVQAVRNLDYSLNKGEIMGIVGESGSGKSVSALAIMRLLASSGKVKNGEILFKGKNLLRVSSREIRRVRGREISMIFQDPMTSLNPLFTIGNQISEGILTHQSMGRKEAREKSIEMLKLVGIPSPEKRVDSYPHEFSGGMRQRAMIAMSLACQPDLLIADEPTTALDVTIQAQVLDLIKRLNQETGTATILITHNLAVASSLCHKIIVMYGGKIMEEGSTEEIFYAPRHPYTMGLLKALPKNLESGERERLVPITGTPPDMLKPPTGCPFYPRCRFAMRICAAKEIPEFTISETHRAYCMLCHPEAPLNDEYNGQKGGIKSVG